MDTSQGEKCPSQCTYQQNMESSIEGTAQEDTNSTQGNGQTSTVQNSVETLGSTRLEENDAQVDIHQDCKDMKSKTKQKETLEILNVELVPSSCHDETAADNCCIMSTGKDVSVCDMENENHKKIVDNIGGNLTLMDKNEVSTKVNDLIDEGNILSSDCDNKHNGENHKIQILNVEMVAPSASTLLKSQMCIEKAIEVSDDAQKSHPSSLQTVYDIMGNTVQMDDKINIDANVMDMNDECNSSSSSSSGCDTMKKDDDESQMDTNEVSVGLAAEKSSDNSLENTNIDTTLTEPPNTSGLSLLAQYASDGDDDADSVVEVPLPAGQEYRDQVVELDSDSDSDDTSDSSDVECLNELRKTIEKHIEIADEDEGDDEDQEDKTGKRKPQQKLRVKGELLLEDLPPIQDLKITVPENDCIEFGKIHSIVDQLVLVSALPNSILLDLETVIFLEKGQKVLGEVFDVLGQVADPLYCVRFNSNDQIKEREINIGDIVYVAPKTQYTQYVVLSSLMKTKGSDASWENDMEPPPRFLDYSDDEQEQLAKRQQRNKDRPNDNDDPSKRQRTENNDDAMSTSSSYQPRPQQKNRYEQRNNRGGPAGHSFVNHRPRFSGAPQYQQRNPNHHRSSWHSNYYPQQFSSLPTSNYRMHSPQNQSQSTQAYRPNMPAHAMPPVRNMAYPPPQPTQYGAPPMFQHNSSQLMPNSFNIRPPNHHGHPQNSTYDHQYTSAPPPPPGSH